MLLLDRQAGSFEDRLFAELPDLLAAMNCSSTTTLGSFPPGSLESEKGYESQAPSRAASEEHLQGQVEVFLTKRLAS